MLLMVAIVGFLKSSLLPALLKLCLTHLYATQYSSSQENGDQWSISSLKLSKYSISIGLPARQLAKCRVTRLRVQTAKCSQSIHPFQLSTSLLLESLPQRWWKVSRWGSWTIGIGKLSCSIARPWSGRFLADMYTIVSSWLRWREWCKR